MIDFEDIKVNPVQEEPEKIEKLWVPIIARVKPTNEGWVKHVSINVTEYLARLFNNEFWIEVHESAHEYYFRVKWQVNTKPWAAEFRVDRYRIEHMHEAGEMCYLIQHMQRAFEHYYKDSLGL